MPRKASRTTTSRKKQHVDIVLSRDVGFRGKTTGLERLEFVHNALPEICLSEIDTTAKFLGKPLKLPFMVSCMTGGYTGALRINRDLAETCQEYGIALGVGSQRQALEDSQFHRTFSIVREVAGTIPIVGNIGAAEVARMQTADPAKRLIELIQADALTVHLNPLQEFLQPEGSTDFRGVLDGIARLVRSLSVPVIVKEIGAGISATVAQRLLDIGVRHIDIAGAGGTSWAGVEVLRRKTKDFASSFWDWGIPTARAIREVAALRNPSTKFTPQFTLIASGGITSGLDAARCVALGADLVGAARPMLQALKQHKKRGLAELIERWTREFRGAMFLTGSVNLAALQNAPLTEYGTP